MTGASVAIAAIVFLLLGVGLSLLGVFCYFMLKMMRDLQASAAHVTRATEETLRQAKEVAGGLKDLVDRNFGDSSATARAARAVTNLSNNLPEVMAGLKVFNDTFSSIAKAAFDQNEIGKVIKPAATANSALDLSQFVPYSEEQAAEMERARSASKDKLDIADEVLRTMRTDVESEKSLAPYTPTSES